MIYLVIGIILILAILAIRVSNKHGVPSLLLFIVLGMIFGTLGFEFNDFEFADSFATVALMVIMFYGGFGTNWNMAKPVAKEAIVLSSLGVITTALLTGLFCHFVLGLDMLEGMLIGSIVGSTDYASVSNILRSKNLNLKYNSASLLELESGSNDPTAYTMTMVMLSIVMGSKVSIPVLIISQIALGLGMGFAIAFAMGKLIKIIKLESEGLYAVFMAAAMLITYAATALIGGNGYLALYVLGIYLGNKQFFGKREVVFFFDGFSQIMQIGLFFILGLLSNGSQFIKALPIATAIMVFMTIVGRPLSVYGLMLPFKLKRNQLNMISLAGIRGAAAIAFAILVVNSGANLSLDVYHIVFGICVISSLIQGSIMPPASKKWDMLDPSDTVLKTFNDYQDKTDVGFLETTIHKNSSLIGTYVRDLNLTFDFIVAKIERDGKTIVPRGHVVLEEGDKIVLAGEVYFDETGEELIEFTIPKGHEWANNRIKDLEIEADRLIVMIQRTSGKIIVPLGNTKLYENDKVIMLHNENVGSMKFTNVIEENGQATNNAQDNNSEEEAVSKKDDNMNTDANIEEK
ncbi:MAG: potassium/proton antiporter [Clostridiales bacterium]|nr:potassium/proton antiporter [Clostridiales bacterium]